MLVPVVHMSQYLHCHARDIWNKFYVSLLISSYMGDPPLCLMVLLQTLMKHASFKWTGEYYPDAAEPIQPKMPKPCGKAVTTACFVDTNHARCHVTQ